MHDSRFLLISISIAWLVVVIAGAVVFVRRVNRRAPNALFGKNWLLLYQLPVVGLIGWLVYNMGHSLIDGRVKLPVRGPESYFLMSEAPVHFWAVLCFELILTAIISLWLVATTYLVLRGHRKEA